jgi:hypothetical protein
MGAAIFCRFTFNPTGHFSYHFSHCLKTIFLHQKKLNSPIDWAKQPELHLCQAA